MKRAGLFATLVAAALVGPSRDAREPRLFADPPSEDEAEEGTQLELAKAAIEEGARAIDDAADKLGKQTEVLTDLVKELETAQKARNEKPPEAATPAAQVAAAAAPPSAAVIEQAKRELAWTEAYARQAREAAATARATADPRVARVYLKNALAQADNARVLVRRMNEAVRQSVTQQTDAPPADRPQRVLTFDSEAFRQLVRAEGLGQKYSGRLAFGESGGQNADAVDLRPSEQELKMFGGQTVNVMPLQAALEKAAPDSKGKGPLFKAVPSPETGTKVYRADPELLGRMSSPEVRKEMDKVGGVALEVTFDLLAFAGVPGFRNGGPAIVVEAPVMISLKTLHDRLAPFADDAGKWDRLPDELRFPGGIERLFGFVLDPRTQDVFLIGSKARADANRIDVDCIVTLLRSVWRDGGTPMVSLDPVPDDPRGPVYSRVIGVPTDGVVAKLMLDADYAMKRISIGDIKPGVPGFMSVLDLVAGKNRAPVMTRSWLSPVPFAANDIHISTTSRTVLLNSRVQVLNEAQQFVGGATTGAGEADPDVVLSDRLFTEHYDEIARSPAVTPAGIFARLRGLVDLVSVCKLLRVTGVNYQVLKDMSLLPVRELAGNDAVPSAWPSFTAEISRKRDGNFWRVLYLGGGIHLRPRTTRRSLDKYQDEATLALEKAADGFAGGGAFEVALPIALTVPAEQSGAVGEAEKKLTSGRADLGAGNFERARRQFAELTRDDPLLPEGWSNLALAEAGLKNHEAALEAIRQAIAQDPTDADIHEIALLVLELAGEEFKPEMWGDEVRRAFSTDLAWRAFNEALADRNDVAKSLAGKAIKLWEDNPDAYYFRSLSGPAFTADWTRDMDRAIVLYKKQIKSGNHQGQDRLALALVTRARARNIEAARIMDKDLEKASVVRQMLIVLGDAVKDTVEARGLDPTLPSAPVMEGELRARMTSIRRATGQPWDFAPVQKHLEETVRDFPGDAEAHRALAMVFAHQEDLKASLAEISIAIRIQPSLHGALCERAGLHALLKDRKSADEDLTRARELGLPIPPEIEKLVNETE